MKSGAFGSGDQFAARAMHFETQLADVLANARAGFDDRLMQLVLELLGHIRGSWGYDLANMRTQFACCGINDLEFFFDADSEAVSHEAAFRFFGLVGGVELRIIPRGVENYTRPAHRQQAVHWKRG